MNHRGTEARRRAASRYIARLSEKLAAVRGLDLCIHVSAAQTYPEPAQSRRQLADARQTKNIIPILLLLFLTACGESDVEIGSGYRYFEVDGPSYAIVNRDSLMVAEPNVTRYKVVGSYIVGEREKPTLNNELFSGAFGYFLLDMKSGEYVEGLDEAELEAALRLRNLEPEPF